MNGYIFFLRVAQINKSTKATAIQCTYKHKKKTREREIISGILHFVSFFIFIFLPLRLFTSLLRFIFPDPVPYPGQLEKKKRKKKCFIIFPFPLHFFVFFFAREEDEREVGKGCVCHTTFSFFFTCHPYRAPRNISFVCPPVFVFLFVFSYNGKKKWI